MTSVPEGPGRDPAGPRAGQLLAVARDRRDTKHLDSSPPPRISPRGRLVDLPGSAGRRPEGPPPHGRCRRRAQAQRHPRPVRPVPRSTPEATKLQRSCGCDTKPRLRSRSACRRDTRSPYGFDHDQRVALKPYPACRRGLPRPRRAERGVAGDPNQASEPDRVSQPTIEPGRGVRARRRYAGAADLREPRHRPGGGRQDVYIAKLFDIGEFKLPGPVQVTQLRVELTAGTNGLGVRGDLARRSTRSAKGLRRPGRYLAWLRPPGNVYVRPPAVRPALADRDGLCGRRVQRQRDPHDRRGPGPRHQGREHHGRLRPRDPNRVRRRGA